MSFSECLKKAAKGVVVGTTLAMIANSLEKDNANYKRTQDMNYSYAKKIPSVNYSDAIGVIMNSNMLSSRKSEAFAIVKRSENEEYYKAIISIINSDMLESYKINAIRSMNK